MKVGVAGVGSMGKNHLRVYRDLGCRVSVYDTNPAARKIAIMYGARFFGEGQYEQFLVDIENALSICTPNKTHKELAERALELKIPTLVEKPLATSSKDAKELVDTAERYDTVLTVGHIERYNPAINKVRELLDGEEIFSVSALRWGQLRATTAESGVLFDLGVHDVDLAYYITRAPVKNVYCSIPRLEEGIEDNAVITLGHGKFDSQINVGWHVSHRDRRWHIATHNESYDVELIRQVLKRRGAYVGPPVPSYADLRQLEGEVLPIEVQEPLLLELRSFLSVATGKQAEIVPPEDAIKAIEIAEAAHKSAKEGRKITV